MLIVSVPKFGRRVEECLMQRGRFCEDGHVALPMEFVDDMGFGTAVVAGKLRGFT